MKIYSVAERTRALAMLATGVHIAEVSKEIGADESTIRGWLKRPTPIPRKKAEPKPVSVRSRSVYISEELRREILRLAETEDPIPSWGEAFVNRRHRHSEIAEMLGVSETVVDNAVKEA